ncbi:MAG: hypothetical protein JXA67_06525 [Micromonosporaceae bacterium]|nr:hypothetical protein [Micromonosporaceae bacterium]
MVETNVAGASREEIEPVEYELPSRVPLRLAGEETADHRPSPLSLRFAEARMLDVAVMCLAIDPVEVIRELPNEQVNRLNQVARALASLTEAEILDRAIRPAPHR